MTITTPVWCSVACYMMSPVPIMARLMGGGKFWSQFASPSRGPHDRVKSWRINTHQKTRIFRIEGPSGRPPVGRREGASTHFPVINHLTISAWPTWVHHLTFEVLSSIIYLYYTLRKQLCFQMNFLCLFASNGSEVVPNISYWPKKMNANKIFEHFIILYNSEHGLENMKKHDQILCYIM